MNFATNFEEARGFVRTNWKSKNFAIHDDPCEVSDSTEESDYGDENNSEDQDKVGDDLDSN